MAKLDYDRPILRLIDNNKKLKAIFLELNPDIYGIKSNPRTDASRHKDGIHRYKRDLIQDGAMIVLEHAEKCGDITPAKKFVSILPSKRTAEAVVSWLCRYGRFRRSETGLAYDNKVTDLDAAKKNPFWLLIDNERAVNFDLCSRVERVIRDAEKAQLNERSQLLLAQLRRVVDEYISS